MMLYSWRFGVRNVILSGLSALLNTYLPLEGQSERKTGLARVSQWPEV